jgi:hypothetical protein
MLYDVSHNNESSSYINDNITDIVCSTSQKKELIKIDLIEKVKIM